MTIEFARQYGYHAAYQEEAKGEGDGGGGDRGDDVVLEDKVDDEVDPAVAAKKAADEADAAAKAAKDEGKFIPKSRFDEATKKERARAEAAEARAAALEAEAAKRAVKLDLAKIEGEIDALEDALEAKMVEGTPAERKELRKQIRVKQEQVAEARADARHMQTAAIAIEQTRYDAVVERLEEKYEFLNFDNKEAFDEELASEVMDLKTAYEATGLGSAAALKKAVSTLGHKLEAKVEAAKPKQKAEEKGAEEKDPAAAKKIKEAEETAAAARRAAAVGKGLEAKEKLPPPPAGKADRTTKEVDVTRLSDADFDKLSDEEKKRLRGD